MSRTVTLRPELSFALKGGRTETEDGSVIDIELAYLEFPILAKVAAPIGRFRPVFFAGPAPALRIGCDFLLFLPEQPGQPELEQPVTCGEDDVTSVRVMDLGFVRGRRDRRPLAFGGVVAGGARQQRRPLGVRGRGGSQSGVRGGARPDVLILGLGQPGEAKGA